MKLLRPYFGPNAGRLCRITDGQQIPLDEDNVPPDAPAVLLPSGEGSVCVGVPSGEIVGPDTRGNRELLARSITEHGGTEEWARSKAETAVRNWDRGVRAGRIQRPRS